MDAKLYNMSGKEAGVVALPESVFGASWNTDLVHQVVTAMQANARTPVAHAKDRSEVEGTSKKPWKQKGTGSARHGSRRSPIWRGGGVTHGPRNERTFKQKINKKMRVKALYAVLSKKFEDGEVLFLDSLTYSEPKTKEAKATILALAKIPGFEKLATKRVNAALVAGVKMDVNVSKSLRNFGNVQLETVRSLSPVDVLKYKYLILVGGDEAVQQIESRGSSATAVVSK
jgi:large subunit ribosomal protein L4